MDTVELDVFDDVFDEVSRLDDEVEALAGFDDSDVEELVHLDDTGVEEPAGFDDFETPDGAELVCDWLVGLDEVKLCELELEDADRLLLPLEVVTLELDSLIVLLEEVP